MPHVQLMLSQMAAFCLSSWGDLILPGHNMGWLWPQRASLPEQIRFWAIITLLGVLAPISSGSTAVSQECGHFSTPFAPSASRSNYRQRDLSELLFTSKPKLVFSLLCHFSHSSQRTLLADVYESLEIANQSPIPELGRCKGALVEGVSQQRQRTVANSQSVAEEDCDIDLVFGGGREGLVRSENAFSMSVKQSGLKANFIQANPRKTWVYWG